MGTSNFENIPVFLICVYLLSFYYIQKYDILNTFTVLLIIYCNHNTRVGMICLGPLCYLLLKLAVELAICAYVGQMEDVYCISWIIAVRVLVCRFMSMRVKSMIVWRNVAVVEPHHLRGIGEYNEKKNIKNFLNIFQIV